MLLKKITMVFGKKSFDRAEGAASRLLHFELREGLLDERRPILLWAGVNDLAMTRLRSRSSHLQHRAPDRDARRIRDLLQRRAPPVGRRCLVEGRQTDAVLHHPPPQATKS